MRRWPGEALKQPETADERHIARDILRIQIAAGAAHAVLKLLGELSRVEQGDLWWVVLEG